MLPSVARGVEVDLTMGTNFRYESNVSRKAEDAVSDYGVELAPNILLSEGRETYEYNVRYRPQYLTFTEQPQLNDVNHRLTANFRHLLTPKLQWRGSDRFSYSTRLVTESELDDESGEFGEFERRTKDLRNISQLGLEYAWSPLLSAGLDAFYSHFDPEGAQRIGNETVSASGGVGYRADDQNQYRLGVSATLQFFEGVTGLPSSRTDAFQIWASYSHEFGEGTALSVRGGPTILQASGADQLDFFILAKLSRRWNAILRSSASYQRSQSDSGGRGGTTIRDRVTFKSSWRVSQFSKVAGSVAWRKRKSLRSTGTPGLGQIDQRTWVLHIDAERRLTRRLHAAAFLQYTVNRSTNSGGTVENLIATLGFRYDFDPLRL